MKSNFRSVFAAAALIAPVFSCSPVGIRTPMSTTASSTATATPTSMLSVVPKFSKSEWAHYAGDPGASKFSWIDQIKPSNVKNLKPAWQWNSPDNDLIKARSFDTSYYEATPIMVNEKLYTSTSLNQVIALNPETGATLWSYDPKTYENGYPGNSGFVHRGVAYWYDQQSKKRILIGTNDAYLISLDAETGVPDPEFGPEGRIDLTKGLRIPIERAKYGVTSAPVVCRDTVIVGSSVADFFNKFSAPPGDVRGFDVRTGALKWTFHTVPLPGEPGSETWLKNLDVNIGNTNVWAPMSFDPDLGAVYLPVSSPANDFYGGERPGNNLFGDSLVSLNCETGRMNWHYQLVHHDLWDYDIPTAPILMDLMVNGHNVKAVAQVTKQAFTYVFNRETGEPIWPIVEKPVPQSTVPGEVSSATQPFPTKPPAFDRQGLSEDDLINFSPGLNENAKQLLKPYKMGPLFTPPSIDQGVMQTPGTFGGASWAGAAYSPVTGKLYVPSITDTYLSVLGQIPGSDFKYTSKLGAAKYLGDADGLPITKPPYGRLTALDMNTGTKSWMVPVGQGPKSILQAKGIRLSKDDLGWNRRIHVLATPTLLFAAQSGKLDIIGVHVAQNFPNSYKIKVTTDDPSLRALDLKTGKTIAKIPLPVNAYGAPMTYLFKGKQYVAVPIGGGGANLDAGIMVLTLQP